MIYERKIVDRAIGVFKQKMTDLCEDFDFSHLSAELGEQMCAHLSEAMAASAAEGLKAYVESYVCIMPVTLTPPKGPEGACGVPKA